MKKLEKVFDNNYLELSYFSFKYGIISIILAFLIIISLLVIKKNYFYINSIAFTSSNTGMIVVDNSRINDLKKINQIIVGDMVVNYNIEKIEETDDVYLVDIKFNEELKINENIYKVFLFKESILEYIIRVMKGDFK